ncbi:MAG: hypothetical protein RL456_1945 [Pseudomonadota bacterium]
MQLTDHFTLDEFTRSDTALRLGIDNTPPAAVIEQLRLTAEMLERVRTFLGARAGFPVPIHISSGYRCQALNRAVNSADTSDHVKGLAVDWTAPKFGTPLEVCRALAPAVDELGVGQLIHEYGRWIHTGVPSPARAVNRVITISSAGTVPGIQAA